MFVGAGLEGGTATAVSYSSPDLSQWTLDGIAAQRSGTETDPVWTGTMWECPQLFEIDGSHVLVTSIWEDDVLHYVAYGVGTYADGKFTARSWGQLSYGKSYYAPSFFRDKEGKAALIFWARGVISPEQTWASALSVPHALTLDGDTLVATPHTDLDKYLVPAQAGLGYDGSFAASLPEGGDLRWVALHGVQVQFRAAGHVLATISHGEEAVTVRVESDTDFPETRMPVSSGTAIRAVLDRGIVEVSTKQGILAFPLPVHVSVTVVGNGFTEVPELRTFQNATNSALEGDMASAYLSGINSPG
jgi:beta-fructofuranosidase